MYIIQSSYRLCRPQPEPSSALGESEKDLFLRRTIEKSLLQPVDDMRRPYTQAFHDSYYEGRDEFQSEFVVVSV